MSCLSSDETFVFSPRDDAKFESEINHKGKSHGKRKIDSAPMAMKKRLVNVKKEFAEIKKEVLSLRVPAPLECACHDVIEIEIATQLPKLSFKRSTSFPQQLPLNGIYFESEDIDPSYILLIELANKCGEKDFQLLQHCEKCKDKRDGKEIITANANNIVSNSKGSISMSISLHEQSAHLDPSYTGGKIKENMKLYVHATLFMLVDNALHHMESSYSEGIKVVAQGKLKNRQVKQERVQLAYIKQDTEKLAAFVNTKQQVSLVSELSAIRERCTTLEDRNQLLETKQEMLEKKTSYLEERCSQMEELFKKLISPTIPDLLALNEIQTQSSPFIDTSSSADFLMATVNGLDSPTSSFDFMQNMQ